MYKGQFSSLLKEVIGDPDYQKQPTTPIAQSTGSSLQDGDLWMDTNLGLLNTWDSTPGRWIKADNSMRAYLVYSPSGGVIIDSDGVQSVTITSGTLITVNFKPGVFIDPEYTMIGMLDDDDSVKHDAYAFYRNPTYPARSTSSYSFRCVYVTSPTSGWVQDTGFFLPSRLEVAFIGI